MSDAASRVRSVVCRISRQPAVSDDSSFDAIGISSLQFVQLLVQVEDELAATFDLEQLEDEPVETVADLIRWVEESIRA
ncbi:MAG: acyl carrier protein [Myxococcales bacterium]|nr:acyl carrier protein [Myxococcales bacterium]